MAKKEKILDVIENGTCTTREVQRYFPERTETETEVVNGSFRAVFSESFDIKDLQKKQDRIDRFMNNTLTYGDSRGKCGVWRDNNTAKELADMSKSMQDCRTHWAMYLEAIKAPKHLQKHVFENLKIWLKEHDINSLNKNFSFDSVAIMPPAWKKGYESVDLFGWCTEYQLDDLMPAAGLEIGKKVIVPLTRREKIEGEIIGYAFRGEKVGYDKRYGRIILWYDVKYGASKYDHAEWKLKDISFPMASAV